MMVKELQTIVKFENRRMNRHKWFVCDDKATPLRGPYDSKEIAETVMGELMAPAKPVRAPKPKMEEEPVKEEAAPPSGEEDKSSSSDESGLGVAEEAPEEDSDDAPIADE